MLNIKYREVGESNTELQSSDYKGRISGAFRYTSVPGLLAVLDAAVSELS
jgi:hypothetical protein